MADGSLDNLFVSLGIRDEMSSTLRKIVDGMKGVDEATSKARKQGEELVNKLNSVNGDAFVKVFKDASKYIEDNAKGVSGIVSALTRASSDSKNGMLGKILGAKDLADISRLLNVINSELAKVTSQSKGDNAAIKAWQSRISNALSYIQILRDVESAQNRIASTKSDNPNVDTAKLKAVNDQLSAFKKNLLGLVNMGGIDNSNVLSYYRKLSSILKGMSNETISLFKKDNPISVFNSNFDKVDSTLSKVEDKLRTIIDLKNEGLRKGYSTSMLDDRILGLGNKKTLLETALLNKNGELGNNTELRKTLSSTAAELSKVSDATRYYGREKGKIIAQEREHNKELSKLEQQEGRARNIAETISRVDRKIREFGETRDVSIKLGTSTTNIDGAIAKLSDLRSKLDAVDTSSKKDVANLISKYKILSNEIGNTKSKQDSLNRSIEALGNKNAAKATREANAAEKQRQTELENSLRRIQSMEKALANLQEKRFTSKMFGLDVSEADAKIFAMKVKLNELYDIANKLGAKDMTAVGKLGNLGNGRETQAANDLARSYDKANKEAQRGVEIEQKRQQEIAKSAAKVQADLVRGFEKANSHAGKLNSTIQDLKSLFLQGGLVFGAQQFAMSIITTGGEMEKQHIALQSILGDMQNANTLFGQIKELALNSPFTFSELNRDVKQLAAYGVEYDQLYDTTKRLADMSSGLGVSFDRIALAFGQVQARGWLDGKELRQIAYAGIPLLSKLSEFYSKQEGRKVSTSEIKSRISNREVSFDDVKSIFWQMTDAGGQFYNMQQTLSETLLGRYNKLKDAWEIMLADFASGKSVIGGTFIMAIDLVTKLVQSLHTLGPVVAAAFSGIALTRFTKSFGGNAGAAFLANKARMSDEMLRRRMSGGTLSPYEQTNFIANRGRITTDDLKTLTRSGQLNKLETQRLYLAGRITTEQYKQTMEMLKQRGSIAGLNAQASTYSLSWRKVGLSIKFAGLGILNAGKSLFSMLGGLPGLALTGITMAVSYFMNKNAELKQAMEQTASELSDRYKQMNEFRNSNNVNSIISGKDTKEIDNAIDSYKEKLKELAPYEYEMFVMKANEKQSHEERLKFLEKQLSLMQEANKVAQTKLSDSGTYSDLQDAFEKAKKRVEDFEKKKNDLMSFIPDQTDSDANNFRNKKNLERFAENAGKQLEYAANRISTQLKEMYKGVKAPKDEILSMQKQTIESFLSGLNIPEQSMKDLRLSIYNGLGIADDALKIEIGNRLAKSISDSMPDAANAIRSGRQLDDASKEKIKKLTSDCIEQMKAEFPRFANKLQGMLDAQNFQAVIKLVYSSDGFSKFTDAEQSLYDQYIPAPQRTGNGKKDKRFTQFLNSIGGVGKNSSAKDLNDAATQKLQKLWEVAESAKNGKYTKAYKDSTMKTYQDQWDNTYEILGIKFEPSYSKSLKPYKPGKNGNQEDKALDELKKRISLYKKMYAEIKKFKDLYGKGALGQLANDKEFEYIFNNKKLFPISDYTNYETSIKELLGTLPANTKDRVNFKNDEKAGIQTENRKLLEDQRKDELNALNKELDVIKEQYDTYKKIYELTGNKVGAQKVAFGGTVQYDTYKKFLEEQLNIAVKHDNVQSGLSYSTEDVKGMSLENVKDKYGEQTRVYDVRKKLEDETNKIKKETIDLMADLIEKNVTISQQIDDENRKYERQLEVIKGIEDPAMRQRAKEGATKTHNENKAKLQFEQFKQESDWVTIFDDLDRVSSATIDSMVSRIDEFSRTTGLSVEVVKQLRDALDKLRKEQIDRNPLPYIFGGVQRGNAIGSFIKDRIGKNASGESQVFVSSAEGKKMGIVGNKAYTKNQLENEQQGAYDDSSKAMTSFAGKMQSLSNIMGPVVDLFTALGEQDSVLGKISGGLQSGFSSAASVSSGLGALGLSSLGPYGAAAAAGLSVASSLIGAFGADYSSYNKAKEQYDNLSSIWDSLISKKTQYMSIHWGTEATEASKEAQRMLEAEIEQTKIIAQKRLDSGASAGSHSIRYRMWKGSYKYDGQNWQDVAPEISRKYGVQFNGMDDLLNMNSDTLSKIKQDYVGLWANMDGDFRDYLEKLIEYGEQADDMIDNLTEKLTGNKFSSLVESWGDAMSQMSNYSDNLVDNFEDNLKKAIVNSMIENIYGDKIKALIEKTKKYAENGDKITDESGNVISEYTAAEYTDIKESTDDLSKQVEATRDFLKKTYGWSDNSSSSSTNSVKGITEETADILLSYVNALRLDCSVIRAEQAKYFPEMSEIAKSQLTQLNMISQNTLRNAEAAERIETVVTSFNNNFNKVLNGTKRLNVK